MDLYSIVIYLTSFFLTCMFACYFEKNNFFGINTNSSIIKKLIVSILIFLPIILVSALRINVGTDYWSYVTITKSYGELSLTDYLNQYQGKEICFYLLCRIIYLINNRDLIFLIMPILICYFLFDFYLLSSKKLNFLSYVFIFCTFFFPKSLNISRQTIAMFILLYSYGLYRVNFKKYIFYLLLAISFHSTAIIGIVMTPIMFIEKFKGRNSKLIINSMYILFSILFIWFCQLQFLSDKVDTGNNNLQLLLQLIPIIFASVFRSYLNIDDKEYTQYLYMALIALVMFLLFNQYMWGFRITYYFNLSSLYLFPFIWKRLNKQTILNLMIKYNILLFFIMQFFLLYGYLQYDSIFPYILK